MPKKEAFVEVRLLTGVMDKRIAQLIGAFENNGWILEGTADIKNDWWFDEIFRLVSTWHPVGTELYLALLTDQQYIDKKKVWAVGVSSALPLVNESYLMLLALNDIKKTDLNQFVTGVNSMTLL